MTITYVDENGNTVKARNYQQAAEALYGQTLYTLGETSIVLKTTYAHVGRGYAYVNVYKVGDKQGTSWGIAAANPTKHKLTVAH